MIPVRILRLNSESDKPGPALEIASILRAGGVMVFPTDTFYGLGANALSAAAVEKIYTLKGRPRSKALSVVVADLDQAKSVVSDPPPVLDELAAEFWPGPLTLTLKARPVFPPDLLGPGGTIALRVPAVPWLRGLLRAAGFPVTATSANVSGEGELDDFEAVRRVFEGRVDLLVDGGRTPGGASSTIVDLSGESPRLVREGIVPWVRIHSYLGRTPGPRR